jgi:hypothetical protein
LDSRSDGITAFGRDGTGQPTIDDELVDQLLAVEQEDPYYEPSSPKSRKYELLCKLERLGYILYCPYPEDFWVMLPAGRERLLRRNF